MRDFIRGLVEHLKDNRSQIVRSVDVKGVDYDPTYGPRSTTEQIETVDFDALLNAIDDFAETFKDVSAEGLV